MHYLLPEAAHNGNEVGIKYSSVTAIGPSIKLFYAKSDLLKRSINLHRISYAYIFANLKQFSIIAQSAGALEYTDCFSAEG